MTILLIIAGTVLASIIGICLLVMSNRADRLLEQIKREDAARFDPGED